MASPRVITEAVFLAFEAEFSRNGYGNAPKGLVDLLTQFSLKEEETGEVGRARLYKRLWCILWVGNSVGKGAFQGTTPTYVYPASLKAIIRQIIPDGLVDRRDPTGERVYKVNIGDLGKAKWPLAKKKKNKK